MTQVVTPSDKPITKGQAGKFCDVFANALVKSALPSEPTQQVLESQGSALADEFVALVRKRVEAMSSIIVRRVRVPDRTITPQAVLDATGRKQYTDTAVVATMPHGEGEWVDVHFFKVGRFINDPNLDKEFDLRGLKPVDPYSLAAINQADPAFADDHPNATHWQDAAGKWCYAAFNRWLDDGRSVSVRRGGGVWDGRWWFAGVSK